jgi:predicted Zn-dependent protease
MSFNIKASLSLLAALFLLNSCAVNPVTGKKEISFISAEQELALGAESDPAIIANYGLYDDDEIQAFINEKGKEMGAISHLPDLEYKFRILDSPVVNAFAVPGGYVYFTRGIMAHFNNEAEFAGVLGHEIGHITARHSAAQLSKQQLYGGLFVAGMIVSPEFRQLGELAQQGLGLMFLKFGRDDESQSDELGVSYSTQIGYDATKMAGFFEVLSRLQSQAGVSIPTFQSTHPDPVDRFNTVHQLADAYQAESGKTDFKVGRDEYLQLIDGMIFGDDPRQGFVKYNTFFHPELKFYFPTPPEWQIVNTPQMVQMAAPDGKALMIMTLSQQQNLQAAVQATVEQDRLEVIESTETRVNGLPAVALVSTVAQQAAQAGQQPAEQPDLRILTYFIEYNGLIYIFHGLSSTADFNTYVRTFSNTMQNFDVLTDPAMINVTPDRIKIRKVNRAATLQLALNSLGVPAAEMESIAILNNMQLAEQLPAGTWIKTIETGVGNFHQ